MDLLFNRYASPFLLMDNFILSNSLSNFIDDFISFINEEKEEKTKWEYFLHKVFDKSWNDFMNEFNEPEETETIDLGATLIKSKNMLNNFTPNDNERGE